MRTLQQTEKNIYFLIYFILFASPITSDTEKKEKGITNEKV